MATPEFIGMQCDHCQNTVAATFDGWLRTGRNGQEMFRNHSEAYKAARHLGWYIAEVELCPACAEAYAVEKSGEEVPS